MVINVKIKTADGFVDAEKMGIYLIGQSFKFVYGYWVSVFRGHFHENGIDSDKMEVFIESECGHCYLRLKPLRKNITMRFYGNNGQKSKRLYLNLA